jgi:nitrogen fixation/metabolism regulation signal transduction histidine kinase
LQDGYREYQELSLARSGLRKIHALTLTLTLLLAVFAAMAGAVLLAGSMTAPLLHVAEGTRAVAEGDYRRRMREFRGNDELNLLARSFNAMTEQLGQARDAVELKQRELENAKAYLERVLANLSAGVVVADPHWRLVTANHGASRILGVPRPGRVGLQLQQVAPELAQRLAAAFDDHALAADPQNSWQRQLELARAGAAPGSEPLALLARGSRLPLDEGSG